MGSVGTRPLLLWFWLKLDGILILNLNHLCAFLLLLHQWSVLPSFLFISFHPSYLIPTCCFIWPRPSSSSAAVLTSLCSCCPRCLHAHTHPSVQHHSVHVAEGKKREEWRQTEQKGYKTCRERERGWGWETLKSSRDIRQSTEREPDIWSAPLVNF